MRRGEFFICHKWWFGQRLAFVTCISKAGAGALRWTIRKVYTQSLLLIEAQSDIAIKAAVVCLQPAERYEKKSGHSMATLFLAA